MGGRGAIDNAMSITTCVLMKMIRILIMTLNKKIVTSPLLPSKTSPRATDTATAVMAITVGVMMASTWMPNDHTDLEAPNVDRNGPLWKVWWTPWDASKNADDHIMATIWTCSRKSDELS